MRRKVVIISVSNAVVAFISFFRIKHISIRSTCAEAIILHAVNQFEMCTVEYYIITAPILFSIYIFLARESIVGYSEKHRSTHSITTSKQNKKAISHAKPSSVYPPPTFFSSIFLGHTHIYIYSSTHGIVITCAYFYARFRTDAV